MVTAYDYSTEKLFDQAGIDTFRVRDLLGMVMLGYDSTISVIGFIVILGVEGGGDGDVLLLPIVILTVFRLSRYVAR